MPLLEINRTRQLTVMLRLNEKTAELVNQYAAFIHCDDADTVIEQALHYVFTKDRDFQDFLKTTQAQEAALCSAFARRLNLPLPRPMALRLPLRFRPRLRLPNRGAECILFWDGFCRDSVG
jgi:hypothetical protein